MEHLQQRLDALKQQEANLLMQLDEVRVLVSAYENTLKENDKGVGPIRIKNFLKLGVEIANDHILVCEIFVKTLKSKSDLKISNVKEFLTN